jgi:hypothetical protein
MAPVCDWFSPEALLPQGYLFRKRKEAIRKSLRSRHGGAEMFFNFQISYFFRQRVRRKVCMPKRPDRPRPTSWISPMSKFSNFFRARRVWCQRSAARFFEEVKESPGMLTPPGCWDHLYSCGHQKKQLWGMRELSRRL